MNILTRKSKQKILQQARFFIFLFFLTSLRLPGDLVKLFTEDDNSVNPIYFVLNKHFLADCWLDVFMAAFQIFRLGTLLFCKFILILQKILQILKVLKFKTQASTFAFLNHMVLFM